MEKWEKQLKKIKKCCDYYQKNICGKTFLIIFSEFDDKKLKILTENEKKEKLRFIEVVFKEENFIHLKGKSKKILYILEKENKEKVYNKLNYQDREFSEEYLECIVSDRFGISNKLEKKFNEEKILKIKHRNYITKEDFSDNIGEQLEKIFLERGYKKRIWILQEEVDRKKWKILGKSKGIEIIDELGNNLFIYNMEKIKIKS